MKHVNLKNALLMSLMFLLLPFYGLSCAQEALKLPQIPAKYILTSRVAPETKGDWEYYLLDGVEGGTYAVSLTETAKKSKTNNSKIEIPSSYKNQPVRGIWHNAFHGCKAQEVKIPTSITVIDFEAFLYSGITGINIPYSVEQIGDAAFYACKDLVYARFQNNNYGSSGEAITCVCDDEEELLGSARRFANVRTPKNVIPDEDDENIEWSSLRTIPSFCFFACGKLKEIAAPVNLWNIEWEAFNGCSSLQRMSYYRLRNIRARAFQGCNNLNEVIIPSSLFSEGGGKIEPYAFNRCGTKIRFRFNNPTSGWLAANPNWWANDLGLPYNESPYYVPTEDPEPAITASDWLQASGGQMGNRDGFVISSYEGEAPDVSKDAGNATKELEYLKKGFLIVPETLGGKPVIGILTNAFQKNDVYKKLRRLYLPRTLRFIDNSFFDGFSNLCVISYYGDECNDQNDLETTGKLQKRIDLSPLTQLEFIGLKAFNTLPKRNDITSVHLPYNLISIGDQAFATANSYDGSFKKLTEFIWDYREPHGSPEEEGYEPGSRLETIGNDAFWKFGWDAANIQDFGANPKMRDFKPATLIFPKTFKYFAVLSGPKNAASFGSNVNIDDITRYRNVYGFNYNQPANNKNDRPGHTFTGCPLIKKVIFRGGENFPTAADSSIEKDTGDLVIPLQAFAFCDSLQTLVIEERVDKTVTFHTQNARWGQTSCGANGAGTKNDFRGDAQLQTIVIPNRYTQVRIQDLAFQGSSRAAIYFSGDKPGVSDKVIGNWNKDNNDGDHWPRMIGPNPAASNNEVSIDKVKDWATIGKEDSYFAKGASANYKGYIGYCFYPDILTEKTKAADKEPYNVFCLNQQIPIYDNVYYEETLTDTEGFSFTVTVGKGRGKDADSPNKFTISNKTAFVCYPAGEGTEKHAVATKYLYDLRNPKTGTSTATIPAQVGDGYPVTKIGDSAFSACFCERDSEGKGVDGTPTDVSDLTTVIVPDSIEEIGDYAFLRAYGVRHFGVEVEVPAVDPEGSPTVYYQMPSSLTKIGKNAFTFCNVEEFRMIPNDCKFFENDDNSDYRICSTFSNNYSLRRITFKNAQGNEDSESQYYKTATYPSGEALPYTTALYSTNGVTYKKNRLLLVLFRDSVNKPKGDNNNGTGTVTYLNGGKVVFDDSGAAKPFLFGAYRMASWVDVLKIGPATTNGEDSGTIYPQPLISGICKRAKNGGDATDDYIHLREAKEFYALNSKVDLYSFQGDVFKQPNQALRGCASLAETVLRKRKEGDANLTLPKGFFAGVGEGMTYTVEGEEGNPGVLDLTNSGYDGIGQETFKDNGSIEKFIAPNRNFTINSNAFQGCTKLETIDLSNAKNLTIKAGAFKGCTSLKTIIWPSGKLTMKEAGAFEGCTSLLGSVSSEAYEADPSAPPTKLTLPANMDPTLGANSFWNCSSLRSVDAAAPASGNHPVTTFGTKAFYACTSLDSFDFDSFSGLTTIGTKAFASDTETGESFGNEGKLGGSVTFPSHIVSFGESAFENGSLSKVIFECSSITLGQSAFKSNSNLTGVYFSNSDCTWNPSGSWNASVFNDCGRLTELQLPSTFPSAASGGNSLILNSSNANIFLCKREGYASTQTDAWRFNGATSAPVYHLVVELSDIVADGDFKFTWVDKGPSFWKRTSGSNPSATILGNIVTTGYDVVSDPSNGIVIFSNGWKLTSSGFEAVSITPTSLGLWMGASRDNVISRAISLA